MAPRIRSISGRKKKLRRCANDENTFYPGEIAVFLRRWSLDYRQLKKLIQAVSPNRPESKRKWTRASYIELRGVQVALELVKQLNEQQTTKSVSGKRRIPLKLIRKASEYLYAQTGREVPFASIRIKAEGGRLIAVLGESSFDILTKQLQLPYDEELKTVIKKLGKGDETEKRTSKKLREAQSRIGHSSADRTLAQGFLLPLTHSFMKRGA